MLWNACVIWQKTVRKIFFLNLTVAWSKMLKTSKKFHKKLLWPLDVNKSHVRCIVWMLEGPGICGKIEILATITSSGRKCWECAKNRKIFNQKIRTISRRHPNCKELAKITHLQAWSSDDPRKIERISCKSCDGWSKMLKTRTQNSMCDASFWSLQVQVFKKIWKLCKNCVSFAQKR